MIICRVCLEHSDTLISLQSDRIDSLPILHMISEFTIKNTEKLLPKYICEACAEALYIAYEFKRKYEDSIIKFIRQTSYQDQSLKTTSEEDNIDTKAKLHCLEYEDQPQDENTTCEENSIDKKLKLHCLEYEDQPQDDEPAREPEPCQIRICSVYQCYRPPVKLDDDLKQNGSPDKLVNENAEPALNIQNVESWAIQAAMESHSLSNENQLQPTFTELLNGDSCNNAYEIPEIASELNHHENNSSKDAKNILVVLASGEKVERETDLNCQSRVLRSNINKTDSIFSDENQLTKKVLDRIYKNHHRGIRNYQCDVCFRWFKTKGHVKTHRILHLQTDKSIKCGKCFLTFLTRTHFRNHNCAYD